MTRKKFEKMSFEGMERAEPAAAEVARRAPLRGPAMQNTPIRTELGMEIRRALLDEKGHQIVPADYSQLELRILGWLRTEKKP